jgi:glycosyltransferase involved in cell wall biosynthesis
MAAGDTKLADMESKSGKKRVLAYGDSGTCATGFGTVMRNVLKGLVDSGKYEVDHLAINYYGDYYDRSEFDYRIYPAFTPGDSDVYGRKRLARVVSGKDKGIPGPWDIFFSLHDHFIMTSVAPEIARVSSGRPWEDPAFSWIGYWPVDGPLEEGWVRGAVMLPDHPVLYTEYGRDEVLRFDPEGELGYRDKMTVIPHGVDTETFRPLPEDEVREFRNFYFQGHAGEGTFLVTNVNRNQRRKDMPRTMAAFAEFRKKVPASYLYLHAAAEDAGGNLHKLAEHFGLTLWKDWGYPTNFDVGTGLPLEELNLIYNASDVVVSTSLGEGWGFAITEAMAAGTPVIAPHHTSVVELLGNRDPSEHNRGLTVKCGGTSLWVCLGPADLDHVRPLTDVDDMAEKLVYASEHPREMEEGAGRALEWVRELSWEKIMEKHWLPLFDRAVPERGKDDSLLV